MNYFNPKIATLQLSPHTPTQQQEVQSIGYFGGDIPSIIVHVEGRKTELFIGQCIPTGGHRIAVENPYARTARVNVMYDAAPALQPVPTVDDQQRSYVSYYNTFDINKNVAMAGGTGLMLKKGRALVEIDSYTFADVYVLPNASPVFLDTKPADYMPDTSVFKHPSGDVMEDMICIEGWAPYPQSVSWIMAANYPPADLHFIMKDRYKVGLYLEPNTALFVIGRANKKFQCNITVRDFGVIDGPSYV